VKNHPSVITINFSGTDYRLAAKVRAGFLLVSLGLLCTAAGLFWMTHVTRASTATVERRVQELESAQKQLEPLVQERKLVIEQLTAMSDVLDARRFSWTRLLTRIEETFPSGAALERLEYHPREHTVVLEGKARSPEALSALMIGLERSRSFTNPLLKHQSMDKGILTFNVTVISQDAPADGRSAGAAGRKAW
jgi:Tfp pilus assembly protein PilN